MVSYVSSEVGGATTAKRISKTMVLFLCSIGAPKAMEGWDTGLFLGGHFGPGLGIQGLSQSSLHDAGVALHPSPHNPVAVERGHPGSSEGTMLEYLAQIGEAEPTHSTLNAIITLLDGDQDGLRLRGKPPPKHHSKSSTVQSIENHATEYRRAIEDNPALRSNIIQIIKRQGRPGITRQIHSPPQYPEIVQAQILCIFGRPLTTTEFEVVAAYLADQNPYIPLFPTHLTQHKAPRDKWLNENWALMYETITKLGLQKEVRSLIGIASE